MSWDLYLDLCSYIIISDILLTSNYTYNVIPTHITADLPDQCCVAKPVFTTHAQWTTQALV